MSATFSQAMIAEKIETHTNGGGKAIVFLGSHKVTVGEGTRVDGQILQGVVGDDNGTVLIEIAQIAGAQMLPATEERQIGFGAP
ncbi:hypothetical protein BH10PSE13_BH10PSE13_23810 [soil metagenome]